MTKHLYQFWLKMDVVPGLVDDDIDGDDPAEPVAPVVPPRRAAYRVSFARMCA